MWKAESATKEDAGEISALYRRVWKSYIGTLTESLLKGRTPDKGEIIQHMESKTYFIVKNGERVIGVVRCSMEHGAVLLTRMVVDEDFRKQGIGGLLTKRVIEYARVKGANKVWLDTSPKLTEAVSLYGKMGFRECGYFKKHYWGEDIKFFELLLD